MSRSVKWPYSSLLAAIDEVKHQKTLDENAKWFVIGNSGQSEIYVVNAQAWKEIKHNFPGRYEILY